MVVVDQEFIHHVAAAAAHLNVIPHSALGDDLHLRADAVYADLAELLAGAGAQTHAVAVAGPDGGIAHIGDGAGTAAGGTAGGKELAHHIAGIAADGDLAPVVTALQNGGRGTHIKLADDLVVGAGADAQTHAVTIAADDSGIAAGGDTAGSNDARRQIIAVHIAGSAVAEADMPPYAGGSQNLDDSASIVAGQGLRIIRGIAAQTQPSTFDRGILGCHRADGQKHQQQHQRHHCR